MNLRKGTSPQIEDEVLSFFFSFAKIVHKIWDYVQRVKADHSLIA